MKEPADAALLKAKHDESQEAWSVYLLMDETPKELIRHFAKQGIHPSYREKKIDEENRYAVCFHNADDIVALEEAKLIEIPYSCLEAAKEKLASRMAGGRER